MAKAKGTDREARERLRRYNARQAVHETRVRRRKLDNVYAIGGVIIVAALATTAQLFYFNGGPGSPTPAPTMSAEAPDPGQNVGEVPDAARSEFRTWTGTLGVNGIQLAIELDGAAAPQTVASFVASAQSGYYPGKTCHRLVISDTAGLLQCGSLDGTGATNPAYSFGPIENAPVDDLYPAGTIAMARAGGDAFSNGHQFFIVFRDTTLPKDSAGGYTVFGKVTAGLEELIAGVADEGTVGAAPDGAPVVPTSITEFTIQ